jgi:CRP-like cAMP-binding protein
MSTRPPSSSPAPAAPPSTAREIDPELRELRTYTLFRSLNEVELGVVRSLLEPFVIDRAGGLLFDRGAAPDGAWLVRQGTLRVEIPRPEERVLEIARLGPGTTVGELALVDPAPRGLRVRALEPCKLWRVDGERFQALRRQGNPTAYRIVRNVALMMCDRLRSNNLLIEHERLTQRTLVTAELSRTAAHAESPSTTSIWFALRGLFGA